MQLPAGTFGPTPVKHGSDLHDAVLLLDELGRAHVTAVLRTGAHHLLRLTPRLVERLLVDDAQRSAGWARDAGVRPHIGA